MSRHSFAPPGARVVDGITQNFTPLGLVIKVRLGDDVRRIPILNEDLTYDELMLMMQRVFRGKLSGSDEVVIKYADEDGDLVTIVDGSDLSFAIQCCRGVLNLTLFVNGKALPPESNEIRHIRQELQSLRKHVDSLLDTLSIVSLTSESSASLPNTKRTTVEASAAAAESSKQANAAVSQPTAVLSPTSGREFDPLSAGHHRSSIDDNVQQKVLSSFGLAAASTPAEVANVRSGTPDSVSSVGSAHSSRQAYQQPVQTGYSQPQAAQSAYNQPQPAQPPYNQPQPAQAGYNQPQAGYAPAQAAGIPGYGQVTGGYVAQQGALPREQQQQQQQPYVQSQQYSQQQMPSPGTGRAGNPYASGLHYGGQYPRPHGQFPQAS